ncbi:MAG: Brp/Blh family beta-carotene 15,15'-dioxygenase [Brevundimonas sp.]|uniref:Brp/Blh family beta-carotene 15,15'-dioxygenase n=1 Tax=Brevundimonas sp. TaxID=1871086 RepID=UPI002737663F|nr:Brp/Blh family beta-carotene 15,15'-dioxygenase [Brevundimonas sp.]MDP3403762.1 Brp/Blh family beta-carotene 15,15'-dioxygenase [Brevundimonas sp.]
MATSTTIDGASARGLPGPRLMIGALALALLSLWAGVPLSGGLATTLACLALLVFGLPHGTLDLELIRARLAGPWTGMVALVLIYLGLAAAMYLVWRIAPVMALVAFLAIAVVHFSEDWDGAGPGLLRASPALALLAAPALLHHDALSSIFVALTGRSEAAAVADLLLVLAPVAAGVAVISVLSLWQAGRRDQAAGAVAAVAGMVLLPPIVGFALYFCLFHSPRHFSDSVMALGRSGLAGWGRVVVPLTLAAGGIALLVFGAGIPTTLPDRIMAASFMTLSILTVPHMLAPLLVRALSRSPMPAGQTSLRNAAPTSARI